MTYYCISKTEAVAIDRSKKFGRLDHWNTESQKEDEDAQKAWLNYLDSLPKIQIVGEHKWSPMSVIPDNEYRENYKGFIHPEKWIDLRKEDYEQVKPDYRRIQLIPLPVPVEGKEEAAAALTIEDYKEVIEDNKRLVRELDVIINGENAAPQASLCDIVSQCKKIFLPIPSGTKKEGEESSKFTDDDPICKTELFAAIKFRVGSIMFNTLMMNEEKTAIEANPATHAIAKWFYERLQSASAPTDNSDGVEYWKQRCIAAERLMIDYDPLYPDGRKKDYENWQKLKQSNQL